MAEENIQPIIEEQNIVQEDPIDKLYKNAKKKLDVGDINNFKKLLSNEQSRAEVYQDLVDAFGDGVRGKIGKDINEFSSTYGGAKKKSSSFYSRFGEWLGNIWYAVTHFPSS